MSAADTMRARQPLPIALQLVEVEREIRTRERFYPRWIEAGKITPKDAEARLDAMRNVRATLLIAEEKERLL